MKSLKENQISISITRNRMIEVFELQDVKNSINEDRFNQDILFSKINLLLLIINDKQIVDRMHKLIRDYQNLNNKIYGNFEK